MKTQRNGSTNSKPFKWNMDLPQHLCFHVLDEWARNVAAPFRILLNVLLAEEKNIKVRSAHGWKLDWTLLWFEVCCCVCEEQEHSQTLIISAKLICVPLLLRVTSNGSLTDLFQVTPSSWICMVTCLFVLFLDIFVFMLSQQIIWDLIL